MRVFIAGMPGAGKTVYLATLFRAAFSTMQGYRMPPKIRPAVGDESAQGLCRAAQNILTGKLPSATGTLTSARIHIDLPGSILWDIGRLTVTLDVADPPGGHCFVAPGQALESVVAEYCAESDGAVVLLPADAAAGQRQGLVTMFEHFLANVRRAKGLAANASPFERIVVAVSKAELLVADARRPLDALDNLSPTEVLGSLYGRSIFDVSRRAAPSGGDWYSIISAFGFRRTDRQLAAVRNRGDWFLPDDPDTWDEWTPFRLLEPVEFLARGVCWRDNHSIDG